MLTRYVSSSNVNQLISQNNKYSFLAGSSNQCRSNGVLGTTTVAPSTTARPQPAPGSSNVRPPPPASHPSSVPGMPRK